MTAPTPPPPAHLSLCAYDASENSFFFLGDRSSGAVVPFSLVRETFRPDFWEHLFQFLFPQRSSGFPSRGHDTVCRGCLLFSACGYIFSCERSHSGHLRPTSTGMNLHDMRSSPVLPQLGPRCSHPRVPCTGPQPTFGGGGCGPTPPT